MKIMKNMRKCLKRFKNGIENLTATTFLYKISINTQGIKESVLNGLKKCTKFWHITNYFKKKV